jgi:hypothetical protein
VRTWLQVSDGGGSSVKSVGRGPVLAIAVRTAFSLLSSPERGLKHMNTLLAGHVAELALFVLAIVIFHELAHIMVARAYGYRTVCLAISPLAVGIVFLDQPIRRYWALQVTVPMVVTALVTYIGLITLPITAMVVQSALPAGQHWPLLFAVGLAMLTSSGDMASMLLESRRPLWGKDRILRDIRLLKRVGGIIRFTEFGRQYVTEQFGVSPDEFVKVAARPAARPQA